MSEYANNNEGYELNWDSAIEKDSPEYILLPEGDYDFTVTKFERARFEGSAKLPPCSMAKLSITVHGGAKGVAYVSHRLYLNTRTEGQLWALFQGFGQR